MKKLEILYEDNHLVAINKNPGEIVQSDITGDRTLCEDVKDYLKSKYNKKGNVFLGITHRLDRPTSGVVLFARTSKALTRINQMFRDKKIMKSYLAIVDNIPESSEGELKHYLKKNSSQNKSYAYEEPVKNSKLAHLSYKMIKGTNRYYLLEIKLFTGRHHQIRSQLAKIGCHIKGDLKYGFPRPNNDKSIHLHACSLVFQHPVSQEKIKIIAPTPNDNLWNALKI